jgi:2-haloalkanoic acid dehalogenase type II
MKYEAVLFDLLTGLLDSWTLWNEIAGSDERGIRWRAEYLRITYRTGGYRPYEDLVAESAEAVGMPRSYAAELDTRFDELLPWPGVAQTLLALRQAGVRLGVVTNCSERLGRVAAARLSTDLDAIVTAERAGFYKPHPKPYALGLEDLRVPAESCLFVAGSPYDIAGAAGAGMAVYWHDRIAMPPPPGAPVPLLRESSLAKLCPLVLTGVH